MTESTYPYRIGIDLGGAKVEALLLAPDDAVLKRSRIPSPAVLLGRLAPPVRSEQHGKVYGISVAVYN